MQLLYPLASGLAKMSICLSYLRIFPGRADRVFSYSVFVFLLISTTSSFLTNLLQCKPVKDFWEHPEHKGCKDVRPGYM